MREAVLLQKVHDPDLLREFERFLTKLCGGLRVELTDFRVTKDSWVKIEVSGEDEAVAVRFLEKEVGLIPAYPKGIGRFSVLRGRVASLGQSKIELHVDVGISSPKTAYAIVPLHRLQGQLVNGRKTSIEQIVDLFGLVNDFPLELRVLKSGEEVMETELTEQQIGLYHRWMDVRLDRLIVLGTLKENVREAVEKSGFERDTVRVDSLGFLDHVVVCKLGTDAAGLVSKLGRRLHGAVLACFCPRRIMEFAGEW